MVDFGSEVCGNLAASEAREWLVANGIGGYASGTVAGLLTRRYHGLLIATLKPPLGRTLLLTKLDETAAYGCRTFSLFTNRWADDVVDPPGFHHLARSYLMPLIRHLADHSAGGISEIFDADPPFSPRGCIAQAWSVAELLRAWQATEDVKQE